MRGFVICVYSGGLQHVCVGGYRREGSIDQCTVAVGEGGGGGLARSILLFITQLLVQDVGCSMAACLMP